jgi:hypothetical protein
MAQESADLIRIRVSNILKRTLHVARKVVSSKLWGEYSLLVKVKPRADYTFSVGVMTLIQ